jgi:probable rRNA maturation factor
MNQRRPSIRLTVNARVGRSFVSHLRSKLRAAHAMLKPALAELSFGLVNDSAMSALHERFMNLSGPTDVLTFPLEFDTRNQVTSGEVVICVPEARRRAKEHGVAVRDELLLYALHGMLHLCGFDDRTARGYARMHRTEDDILTRLGIGAVFNPGRRHQSHRKPRKSTPPGDR